jgi:hypothetical protein
MAAIADVVDCVEAGKIEGIEVEEAAAAMGFHIPKAHFQGVVYYSY